MPRIIIIIIIILVVTWRGNRDAEAMRLVLGAWCLGLGLSRSVIMSILDFMQHPSLLLLFFFFFFFLIISSTQVLFFCCQKYLRIEGQDQ